MKLNWRGFSLMSLLLSVPLACQKTYTVSPLPVSTPTPIPATPTSTPTLGMPTPTPTCYYPPSSAPCSSGIAWNLGQVLANNFNGAQSYSVELWLSVNCASYTSAMVTFSGPGGSLPVTYDPYGSSGSTTSSLYDTNSGSISITPGAVYTLTSVTTSGTATASLVAPPLPLIPLDGSTASWSGSSMFNFVDALDSSNSMTYESSPCWSASSPVSIPSSAYPSSGAYYVVAQCMNWTTSIAGGSGFFFMSNAYGVTVTK